MAEALARERRRRALDDREAVEAERVHDLLGRADADALDAPGAEELDQPLAAGGRAQLRAPDLELAAEGRVRDPAAREREGVAGLEAGQGADDGDGRALAGHLDARDGVAVLLVAEGDGEENAFERRAAFTLECQLPGFRHGWSSGGFVDDSAVMRRRPRDAADDIARFFEALAAHHEDVERKGNAGKSTVDGFGFPASVCNVPLHDEQVDVAVGSHPSGGRGAEQDHAFGLADSQDATHDLRERLPADRVARFRRHAAKSTRKRFGGSTASVAL